MRHLRSFLFRRRLRRALLSNPAHVAVRYYAHDANRAGGVDCIGEAAFDSEDEAQIRTLLRM